MAQRGKQSTNSTMGPENINNSVGVGQLSVKTNNFKVSFDVRKTQVHCWGSFKWFLRGLPSPLGRCVRRLTLQCLGPHLLPHASRSLVKGSKGDKMYSWK